jgi:hypothetical protein
MDSRKHRESSPIPFNCSPPTPDSAQPATDKITVREIVKAALVVLFVVLYIGAVMYFAFDVGRVTSEIKLEMQHRY